MLSCDMLSCGPDHCVISIMPLRRQCPAEELPLADGSADLVSAMSAFHWFDRARFLQEAHRVLKPGGCLALLNYTMDMDLHYGDCCSHTLNLVCREVSTSC